MERVLEGKQTPHRWCVILRGHFEDIELAREALEENLKEVWIGFNQVGDDDEKVVTINLRWLDRGMIQIVRDIIESDHYEVRIIYNGGVNENGDRVKT